MTKPFFLLFVLQFAPFNESPLYLQLDPLISPTAKDLPIVVYESSVELTGEKPHYASHSFDEEKIEKATY